MSDRKLHIGSSAGIESGRRGSILLIEDDEMTRNTISAMLRRLGFVALNASGGEDGVRLFRQANPMLVITDMVMPGMDGIDTIRTIKAVRPDAKILAMSGGGRIDNVDVLAEAARAGADGILAKPFTIAELATAAKSLLGRMPQEEAPDSGERAHLDI